MANLVAGAHLLLIAIMVFGGLAIWRWPRMVWVHVPCALAILVVNVLGTDCPLTTLELWLREAAGQQPYTDGFISHYLIEPWHPLGITPTVGTAIYAVALVPNVVAYSGVLARWLRRRGTDRDVGSVDRQEGYGYDLRG